MKKKLEVNILFYSPTEDISKYEGINLEDDIEKVEVTSQEESSSEEDEENEITKSEDRPIFSGIPTQNASESVKTWLQRITEMQNEIQKKYGRQEHLQMVNFLLLRNSCTN